jgi:hypothetical protein
MVIPSEKIGEEDFVAKFEEIMDDPEPGDTSFGALVFRA